MSVHNKTDASLCSSSIIKSDTRLHEFSNSLNDYGNNIVSIY